MEKESTGNWCKASTQTFLKRMLENFLDTPETVRELNKDCFHKKEEITKQVVTTKLKAVQIMEESLALEGWYFYIVICVKVFWQAHLLQSRYHQD